jgi:hypothetical protein
LEAAHRTDLEAQGPTELRAPKAEYQKIYPGGSVDDGIIKYQPIRASAAAWRGFMSAA